MGVQTLADSLIEGRRNLGIEKKSENIEDIMPRKAEAAPVNLDEPPKKARGAYILYGMDARPQIVAANPDMKVTEVMKTIGAQWQELDEDDKARYKKLADEDKARYEEERDAFLSAGGDEEALNRKPRKAKK